MRSGSELSEGASGKPDELRGGIQNADDDDTGCDTPVALPKVTLQTNRFGREDSRDGAGGKAALISLLSVVVCLAVSSLVLAGWQFQIPWLRTLPGHRTVVAPNSALLFIASALSLLFLRRTRRSTTAAVTGRGLAALVCAFGVMTLAEYVLQINLGIDTVFFHLSMADWPVPTPPGRFALQAALAFALAGLSLLLLDVKLGRVPVSEPLAGGVALLCFLSLLGYAYNVQPLHGILALETTLIFCVLAAGLLFVRPHVGATALLLSRGAGGIAARYLLATVVVMLTVFGWAESKLESRGVVELDFGTALMVAVSAVAFSLLILWTAYRLEKADRALRHSEATLAQAGQMARLGAWKLEISNYDDLHANPLQWSAEVYRIFGYEPAAVAVSNALFVERVHPEDRQRVLAAAAEAIARKEPYEIEHRIVRPDGVERIVLEHAEITFDDRGRPLRMIGAVQDITERKRAEQALQQSEVQFRTLTETIPQLCWMADRSGSCQYLSKRWEEYTGIALHQLLGLGWIATVFPGDMNPLMQTWTRAAAGDEPYAAECRLRAASGGYEWFLVRAVKLPDRDLWFGTMTNIEYIKQAQQALIRTEKLASVGRMASTIAHEINNPLAAMMNTLYLAKNHFDDPKVARHYLEVAEAELKRVSHITRQALGFYRDSSAPAPASVGAILDSVLDLLDSKVKEKRVIVEKEYDGQVEITAVAGELRQVFSNLVVNSLDAVRENGTIKLRVSRSRFDRRDYVRVTIADNGRGIDRAVLPHIFEPFFTTKDSVGTGLGLWVSKQIIDKHGGSVRVHSRVHPADTGTVFSVLLPCQPFTSVAAAS